MVCWTSPTTYRGLHRHDGQHPGITPDSLDLITPYELQDQGD